MYGELEILLFPRDESITYFTVGRVPVSTSQSQRPGAGVASNIPKTYHIGHDSIRVRMGF